MNFPKLKQPPLLTRGGKAYNEVLQAPTRPYVGIGKPRNCPAVIVPNGFLPRLD